MIIGPEVREIHARRILQFRELLEAIELLALAERRGELISFPLTSFVLLAGRRAIKRLDSLSAFPRNGYIRVAGGLLELTAIWSPIGLPSSATRDVLRNVANSPTMTQTVANPAAQTHLRHTMLRRRGIRLPANSGFCFCSSRAALIAASTRGPGPATSHCISLRDTERRSAARVSHSGALFRVGEGRSCLLGGQFSIEIGHEFLGLDRMFGCAHGRASVSPARFVFDFSWIGRGDLRLQITLQCHARPE